MGKNIRAIFWGGEENSGVLHTHIHSILYFIFPTEGNWFLWLNGEEIVNFLSCLLVEIDFLKTFSNCKNVLQGI